MSTEIEKIEPFHISRLTDVIDEEVLRMIQTGVAERLNIALVIVERTEHGWRSIGPVDKRHNYCEFCKYLRGYPGSKADMECVDFDSQKAYEVSASGNFEPQWYFCRVGLVDVIFPIVIDGRMVASFLSGQKRLEGRDDAVRIKVREMASRYKHLRLSKMMRRLRSMIPLSELNVKMFMSRLAPIVNHITKLGEHNYAVQKRLREEEFLKELSVYLEYSYEIDINPLWDRLERVLRRTIEFTQTTKVAMFYANEDEEFHTLSCKVAIGLPKNVIPHFQEFKLVNLEPNVLMRLDPSTSSYHLLHSAEGSLENLVYYVISVPLRSGLDGVLAFGVAEETDLLDSDIFLVEIANLVSTRIQRAYFEFAQHQRIREREEHVRELERLSKQKEEFVAEMSHALRAPMQSVLSETGYLAHRCSSFHPQDGLMIQSVNKVIEEVGILRHKLENSIFSGDAKIEYNMKENDLVTLIEECADQFRNIALRDRDIGIIVEVEDIPSFRFDRDKMDIMLTNLLENAVKYSHGGKDIYIRGTVDDNEVRISVQDLGLGIKEEEKEKIFQKYYRAELRDRRRFISGTGIGLTVVKRIVEAHRGSIEIDSRPAAGINHDPEKVEAGEGFLTTFTIHFAI